MKRAQARLQLHRRFLTRVSRARRGREALQSLIGQRERLKGAHQKALDMLNLLGISQSVVRVMQRRNVTDRYIVYGGMAATTVFMYICYRLTRGA